MNVLVVILAGVSAVLAVVFIKHLQQQSGRLQKRLLASEEHNRRQMELLEQLRKRDRQLIHSAGDAIFVFAEEDAALIEINQQAELLLGYCEDEVKKLSFKVLFSREHQQRLLRMISKVSNSGRAEVSGIKFRRKDGSHFIGDIKVLSGQINEQKIVYGSFRDTTQITNLQLELQRHNRHLSLLNEISHRVTEGHDLPQTLDIILDEVIRSFDISGGGIFLLEQHGTEMKLALHRNIPDNVVEELGRIQPGMGLAGKVAQTGRPRLSTNLQKDHRRISSAVFADSWRAFLAVPFIAEEKTLGVLFVFDRGNRVFSRDDVRLIQAIGRQLGPLLKNAELFDELQWQHRLNSASLRELERSRAALRDNLNQLEQNHRELQNLNQMKSSFLSLASHELRTPLTTILSGAEFLQSGAEHNLGENEQKALEVIMRASQRLNDIVDDLLEAARLEARTLYMAREAFNPEPMLQELYEDFRARCASRDLQLERLDLPGDIVIRGDVHHLKRAFGRLLENGMKFTPPGGCIRISGRVRQQKDITSCADRLQPFSESFFNGHLAQSYLEISISDNGVGIEATDHLRIFDKFHEVGDISRHSTSRASFGGKGVGLGLTLVKGIIETHSGLIWVESEGHNQGSRFSVILPLSTPDEGKYVLG